METAKTEAKKFILNYGVLLGILSILLGVITYVTNAHLEPSLITTIVSFAVLIVVIILGIKAFKSENAGYLTLGESLKIGVGIALIGSIFSAIWMLILMNFLEPAYMAQMAEIQREAMIEANPTMTDQQINAGMEMAAKFSSPWISIAFIIVGGMFMGLIISLIAGLVMKKENPYTAQG
ncbi:MAG TPA: DUF4199 domain-containing protein [Gillisia sp.]|nr:DUF4199 domain-containing protein [Gillisia sp.]